MWTIAAINKKFNGPLGSYSGLTDVHLAHYFSRPSRQSHLKAAKLITEDGFIIPEKNVKGALYIDEKKKNAYDILARTILQTAIHKEGSWNKKLCNYLEDISKIAAVDKARRCLSGKEHSPYIVPLLLSSSGKYQSYSVLDTEETSKKRLRKKFIASSRTSKTLDKKNSKKFKTINIPVPLQSLKFSHCKITFFYHGHLHLSNFQRNLTKNILIKQQHHGGTPVVIYKGKISTNDIVSFFSLDHDGFFFSIIVFLNGIRELKLSSCCVFRYLPGRRFGGQNGTFSLKEIEGGTPCLKCQYQDLQNKNSKSFIHISDSSVNNSDSKENSLFVLDAAIDKTNDKTLDEISAAEDNSHASVNVFDMNETQVIDESKSVDEDIEEILDSLHNDEKVDSYCEEHVVGVTNANSVDDGIKGNVCEGFDSQQNISKVSDTYQEPKNSSEISIDSSSSENERENSHFVTVSVHGSFDVS